MLRLPYRFLAAAAPFVPERIKEEIRGRFSMSAYDHARQRDVDPYREQQAAIFPASRYRFGIVFNAFRDHQYFIGACRDLHASYATVDLLADDWMERVRREAFDAVLVWPDASSTVRKQTLDYRLRVLEHDLGMLVYPTWEECWLTEHKPRLRDWLDAHELPHPKTWVFHDREEALAFADCTPLPIVSKTATGAGASGVCIHRERHGLNRFVRQSFGRGVRPRRFDALDRQRGFVFLQEYLPDAAEWRMVRIGDSYFGYRKEKGADGLHSASHKWSWLDPGPELLDLLRRATDAGGFTSMNVDIFLVPDGRLLINEFQTVFGCTTPAIYMKVNEVEGRYRHVGGNWTFEPGGYWDNHMCNLRVQHVMGLLEARRQTADKGGARA